MKKLVIMLVVLAFSGSAYAATEVTQATITLPAVQGFKNSKNVGLAYASWSSGVSGSATADLYAIASKHIQGDKIYGTTSASPYIGVKTGTSGTAVATGDVPSAPNSPSDSAIGTFSQM